MVKRRLICPAQGVIEWAEIEDSFPKEGQVRVRNEYGVEKHGTMQAGLRAYGADRGKWNQSLHMHVGTGTLWDYPFSLGNMNLGTVTEVGDGVQAIQVGDRVCFNAGFEPVSTVGAEECFVVTTDLAWKDIMLHDPGTFALGAIRDGNVRIGDDVVVFGLGAIGLVTIQLLRAAGVGRIVGVDVLPNRRAAGLKCGADVVLGENTEDIGLQVRQAVRMTGLDVAIDFSGAVPAIQAAMRSVGSLATVVLGAYPPAHKTGLDFGGDCHANQIQIIFTRACSDPIRDYPRWDWERVRKAVIEMIIRGDLDGSVVVDDPIPFDSLLSEYPKIAASPDETIKLSVKYP
jgi:threonine dehydrogenase-like Zn-dependent dehydrogenase